MSTLHGDSDCRQTDEFSDRLYVVLLGHLVAQLETQFIR